MLILFILQITPTAVRWLQTSTRNRPPSAQTQRWSPWWTVSLTTPTLPSKKRNSVSDSSKSVTQSCMPRTSMECCNNGTQFIGLMVLFLYIKWNLLICTFSDNAGFIVSSAILYFFLTLYNMWYCTYICINWTLFIVTSNNFRTRMP